MEFEFDPAKSAANLEKHGIDFVQAQEIWFGETLQLQANSEADDRVLVIGLCDGKLWSAICTQRALKMRIISVRRARESERALYENR